MPQRSPEYIQFRQQGAFAGKIDPWAEAGRYFQQIHSGMIHQLQDQLQDQLNALDYQAGKEASLQIFANRQPDIYVQDNQQPVRETQDWDYVAVADELQVEAGVSIIDETPDLEALHITDLNTGDLVTVIEIISPRNKTHPPEIVLYKEQRARVFLSQGVNVVEIDATRSNIRLLNNPLVQSHPYHIAIYLPEELPRVLVSQLDEALKPFALPLRGEAIRTDPQSAYDIAYQRGAIAGLIQHEVGYALSALPFPTLLTDEQQQMCLSSVQAWQAQLKALT